MDNNLLQYERQCTRLLSSMIDSPQNYLKRMTKYGIDLYICYSQAIINLPRKKITTRKYIAVTVSSIINIGTFKDCKNLAVFLFKPL